MNLTRRRNFRIAVREYPPFVNAIQEQWHNFQSLTNTELTLDLVALDLPSLEHALFTSNGMAQGDWDVAFVATDWIAAMHGLGAAVDLAPMLEEDPPLHYPEGWTPSLLRLQRIHSAVLGVPYHDGPECLMYRRDLFTDRSFLERFHRQFDRPLRPPRTWEEFHQVARFLNNPSTEVAGTAFAAFPDGHNSVYDFLLQLWTRKGELIDQHGLVTFQTKEAFEALTFYREILQDADAVHPGCSHLDSVSAGLEFAAGKIAFMVNWFGFATYAHTSPDSAVRGLVDIAPIPSGTGGISTSLNVYWILSLASGSPHRDLAWQFLRHTQTPAMDLLTSTHGAIGTRRSTWSDPNLNAQIPFYHQLEALHASAREIPQRPDWPRIASAIDRLITSAANTSTQNLV